MLVHELDQVWYSQLSSSYTFSSADKRRCMFQMEDAFLSDIAYSFGYVFRGTSIHDEMKTNRNNECSYQRHSRQHNDGKVISLGSLLGVPVKVSNGIAVQTKHKNNNQTYMQRGLWGIQTACLGGLHRGQNLNTSQQVWCWNSIRIII